MSSESQERVDWWAKGLLFESCNCTLVCPGHVHFSQKCTHDRCRGYWAARFDAGEFGHVQLAGTSVVVLFDSPQRMIDGGWIEVIVIGENATPEQRVALHSIFRGSAGGPWEVLDRFVGERLETLYLPIEITDEGKTKKLVIPDMLHASVEALRGRDRGTPVTFENIFNQIHPPSHALALGATQSDGLGVSLATEDSHGLYSTFHWVETAS